MFKPIFSIASGVVVSALALATMSVPSAQAQTSSVGKQVFCDNSGPDPLTVVQESSRSNALIVWKSTYWVDQGLTPLERCNQISNRLSNLSRSGAEFRVTTGRMNGSNVICATQTDPYFGQYPCRSLILTLEPGENPTEVLRQFTMAASGASGYPLVRGSGDTVLFSTWVQNSPTVEEAYKLFFEQN
jgi:hypothetical protein